MVLYAIERLDDAVQTTRAFLFPVGRGRWLRLAVITLFAAGGTGGALGSAGGQTGAGAGAGVGPGPTGSVPGWVVAAAAAFVVLVVALAVVLGIVSATMEFALVESLRSERVAVREYVGRFWRRGARLFGFQVGVALLGAAVVLALVALTVAPALVGVGLVSALVALLTIPLVVFVAVTLAVVEGFTVAFVVPVSLAEDCGVVEGWRRFWPTLRSQPAQFGTFAVLGVVVLFALSILVSIAVAVPVVLLAIPFALVVGLGVFVGQLVFPLGVAIALLGGLAFLVGALAIVAVVQVPVQVFLRFYALYVLGDADADFDLLADRREPLEG
jgi:hypothetical protein